MNACDRFKEVETWFDTQTDSPLLEEHLAACSACRDHVAFLRTTRTAMRRVAETAGEHKIDAERFLTDYRERVEAAPRGFSPRWALVSAAGAAFLVAISLMSIVSPGNNAVDARSYVDSAQSDIEGATTETYHADDGTAIVWVNVPEGDMW